MTTTPHRRIVARRVTAAEFSGFGQAIELLAGGTDVVTTHGAGWSDHRSLESVLGTPGHLGLTIGSAEPLQVAAMERHLHTKEALFCAGAPVVVAVADTSGEHPHADDVRAFVIEPGDVVILDEGIWHSACHGLGSPTPYYWLATADDSIADVWAPVTGGPIEVDVDFANPAIPDILTQAARWGRSL